MIHERESETQPAEHEASINDQRWRFQSAGAPGKISRAEFQSSATGYMAVPANVAGFEKRQADEQESRPDRACTLSVRERANLGEPRPI